MGKRFKALTDSGAALSLVHTSIYSMIEDHYKTKIVPAAVNLNAADGSAMCSLGKATLHLHIAKCKFSHTFVICDKLPDTDIVYEIDIENVIIGWNWSKDLYKQKILHLTEKNVYPMIFFAKMLVYIILLYYYNNWHRW